MPIKLADTGGVMEYGKVYRERVIKHQENTCVLNLLYST